jgi:hypothetical protein
MTEQPADGPTPGDIPFGMLWGIKRSFVAYVRRMPDGQGSIHDGAVPLGEDTILFPPADTTATHTTATGSTATGSTATDGARTFAFRGDVRFRGHAGMLFVRVAAPLITVREDRAELSIEDPYARADADRVPLVTLQLRPGPGPEGAQVWLGSDVRLTEAGAELFNDVYQPGEPFEQLSVILPAAD